MALPDRLGLRGWAPPDPWMAVSVGALFALGMVMIQSSTVTQADGALLSGYFVRQLVIGLAGVALAVAVYHWVSMSALRRLSPWLLLLGVAMLLMVKVPGLGVSTKEGVSRWIDLGVITFQPVEAVKLFLILYVSAYCAKKGAAIAEFRTLVPVAALGAVLVGLLLMQPDYGSSVILMMVGLVIVFVAGMRFWHVGLAFALAATAAAAALFSSSYRMARVMAFLNPFADPLHTGYHQTHSLMAFGRGGWTGTGLGLSVEKWSHLPEAHNDFIVSVIAEELGFVGMAAVLVLYGVFIVRSFIVAEEARLRGDMFARHVLVGIASLFALQVFVNVGGNLSMLPAKGLTLPFVSYGGSSLLTGLLAVGVALRAVREQGEPPEAPSAPRVRCAEAFP